MGLKECRRVQLPRLSDGRGSLSFVEGGEQIPFGIARIYYLYGVPEGVERGGHGHRELEQLIIAIYGSFEVVLDDGHARDSFLLERPDEGLYVRPMMWREVRDFSPGAVCLVLASMPYDEADYYREYDEFLSAARGES